MRGGPSGRPPSGAMPTPSPSGADPTAPQASPLAGDATGASPAGASTGASSIRPGSRAANRAAKRASTVGVRPKTQIRRSSKRGGSGSSTGLIVLGAIAVVVVAALIVIGNPFGSASPSGSPVAATSPTPVPSHGDGTCPTSQPASLKAGDVYEVTVKTELGDIVMKIDGALAPIATGNFVALVKCHFYDGITFHRLVPGFVIQGGDPAGTGGGGPGYTITDDPRTTTYHRGTIAMARSPQPNSQGSQFFIVLDDAANSALTDPSVAYPYAILGEVTAGMDVVDKIAALPNSGSQTGNQALNPIVMQSVTITSSPSGSVAPTTAPTAAPSPSTQSTTPPASCAPPPEHRPLSTARPPERSTP
jgi:peptidyl-prolyl cis-trans isomerase B (cyclophilin B)